MNSKAFRIFGGTALMLSAAAAMLPEAVQAAPPQKVKIAGTAKVNITNIPTVNLSGTPTVRLETGSTVALQPGSAVSLAPGTTVSLPPGATVGLQPGAAVALQPGSTVGLAPGSTVSLPTGTKVGLETGATVKLDPTSTVSVQDNAAREAVQKPFTVSMQSNESFSVMSFAVPTGKILVVEYLSCSVRLSTGQSLYADLATTTGSPPVSALHSFFAAPSFSDGSSSFQRVIISASTRLYAGSATTVTLTVRRTDIGTVVSAFPCSLSGYYVDA